MLDDVPVDIRASGPEAVEEYETGYYHGCRIVAVGRILYDHQADPSCLPGTGANRTFDTSWKLRAGRR